MSLNSSAVEGQYPDAIANRDTSLPLRTKWVIARRKSAKTEEQPLTQKREVNTLKIVSKIFGFIATLATILVVLVAGAFWVPRFFHINTYIVLSGSMEPMIHTGSVAYIDENDTDVTVGDVITFKLENGEYVTHRIVEETEDGQYVTKGDANDVVDLNTVSKEQVVGTYMTSIPKVGFVLSKKDKLLPLAIVWIVVLNLLAILFEKFAAYDFTGDSEEEPVKEEAENENEKKSETVEETQEEAKETQPGDADAEAEGETEEVEEKTEEKSEAAEEAPVEAQQEISA